MFKILPGGLTCYECNENTNQDSGNCQDNDYGHMAVSVDCGLDYETYNQDVCWSSYNKGKENTSIRHS